MRYLFNHSYRSGSYNFNSGDVVKLTDDIAGCINLDSPGSITAVSEDTPLNPPDNREWYRFNHRYRINGHDYHHGEAISLLSSEAEVINMDSPGALTAVSNLPNGNESPAEEAFESPQNRMMTADQYVKKPMTKPSKRR